MRRRNKPVEIGISNNEWEDNADFRKITAYLPDDLGVAIALLRPSKEMVGITDYEFNSVHLGSLLFNGLAFYILEKYKSERQFVVPILTDSAVQALERIFLASSYVDALGTPINMDQTRNRLNLFEGIGGIKLPGKIEQYSIMGTYSGLKPNNIMILPKEQQ